MSSRQGVEVIGGHGQVVADILLSQPDGPRPIGFLDDNAVRHGQATTLTVNVGVGDELRIEVSDNGNGIVGRFDEPLCRGSLPAQGDEQLGTVGEG